MSFGRQLHRLKRWAFFGGLPLRTAFRLFLGIAAFFVVSDLCLSLLRPVDKDVPAFLPENVQQQNVRGVKSYLLANRPEAWSGSVEHGAEEGCRLKLPYHGVGSEEESVFRQAPQREEVHVELAKRFADHTEAQHIICRGVRRKYARALLFACPNQKCIGLLDGLRGVLFTYVLAVLTDRLFFVRTDLWMPLEKFLQPPKSWRSIDWMIESCAVAQLDEQRVFRSNLERSKAISFLRRDDPGCGTIFSVLRNRRQVVTMLTDQDLGCANRFLTSQGYEVLGRKQRSVYTMAFSQIFRFSDSLMERARLFAMRERWRSSRSICIHVRSGSFQQDARDAGHRNLVDFWRCARLLEKSVGLDRRSDVTWMVFGDNDSHAVHAQRFLSKECPNRRRVLTTQFLGAKPQHDRSANESELERIFFDMLMLSKCDYIVGSKSQFVTFAASLGMQTKIFLLVREKKLMDKPLTDICHQVIPDWDGHYVLH